MKGNIKIRTMRDDLANANDENKKISEVKQDQNKPNIVTTGMDGSIAMPNATPDKLKDKEVSELKSLIEKISADSDKKNLEKDVAIDTVNEKTTSEKQKQDDLKKDEKKELKNLINKISKTIEKKEDKNEEDKEKNEEDKESFWSDVSKNLKNNKLKESVDSGVLIKDEPLEIKEESEEKKEKRKKFYDNANYQPPENRLIFGKQEKYSSVSKRIKLKEKKDEIKDLKNSAEVRKKQKIISEKEKYAQLKNRLIKKYHIKLFSLPWKKIIPIAIILIVLFGATYYTLIKKFTVTPPEPPATITGTEIEKFARIENALEFTGDNIIKIGFKENAINKKFGLGNEITELRVVIKNNGKIVSLKEALESVKIETENFPNNFWETTTESYNIFAIKTGQNAFRFAIAIESNDIVSLLKTMGDWERESVEKRKMFNIFEPFFTDSKIEKNFDQHFKSANYKYTYIRYINLSDKNTSFEYFANDGLLIIATSKENSERIIDILSEDYYEDYYGDDYDGFEN